MTKVELELIPYPDMYLFFEEGIRGGVSYFSMRYSKANNMYLKSYDPKQESKLIYLDANKLYGCVISKFLPTCRLKWVNPIEFGYKKHIGNSSKGCVLEVDLEHPKELCELHNDYPLALDKIEIKRKMSSNYQLKNADFYNIPISN